MYDLSINFEKIALVPLNCDSNWVKRMCGVLSCECGKLPMT